MFDARERDLMPSIGSLAFFAAAAVVPARERRAECRTLMGGPITDCFLKHGRNIPRTILMIQSFEFRWVPARWHAAEKAAGGRQGECREREACTAPMRRANYDDVGPIVTAKQPRRRFPHTEPP
jgi:hypothetical protein